MTLSAAAAPVATPANDQATERLRSLLDADFLTDLGWIEERLLWRPRRNDPLVGFEICAITGCQTVIGHRKQLCAFCTRTWQASGRPLDDFTSGHRRNRKEWNETICAVTGCERPTKSAPTKLCTAHLWHHQRGGTGLDEFLTRTDLAPYPHPGLCRVRLCDWRRYAGDGFCRPHSKQAKKLQNTDPGIDLEDWIRTAPARRNGRQVDLRGLPPRVVAEILFGLQYRYRAGSITEMHRLRPLCNQARAQKVGTLEDLVTLTKRIESLRSTIVKATRVVLSDPETERHKDVWNLAVFGQGNRTLDFTGITQPWLREVAKYWVSEDMPRRRGDAIGGIMQTYIASLTRLSESLRLHRPEDHGNIPALLDRTDAVTFLNRLAYLTSAGTITQNMRIIDCRNVKRVLNDLRNRGRRLPGDTFTALPTEFTFLAEDIPKHDGGDEPGRSVPERVLAQLCSALPLLEERSGSSIRVAIELLIDTGRRPDEICRLPFDCLGNGGGDKSVLIYHDYKNNRPGRRLPIADATAEVIRSQQRTVRRRFPDTPLDELALLPGPKRNPHGTRRLTDATLSWAHRAWVDALPPLLADGDIEFDKSAAVPYAYRHSYAQRHSDAGVPPDVLRDLMGHKTMRTTQIYYRISGQRMRQAVEKVAAHQFDRNGQRTWQHTQAALDDEHARLQIGQVSVPFGVCLEPSNVKAGGHACPFRFRCLGCGHFRTDASYLPELKDYLHTLLRDRERVLAAGELDPWARVEAAPSEAEITKLRQLIHRVEASMDELTSEERQQIEQATAALRQTRQGVDLGMPIIPSFVDQTRNGVGS
ncbi:tyrosine-type recombinase/integrase [Rhodococcus sp. O3]|uniref:tyrosine-type recombinase/integrase n=1 Tax=Rhodococcus sp. O3 TaxID=3404919 RepID=UPI003B683072